MQQSQRGFFFPLLVLVVALLAVGGGVYYSSQRQVDLPPAPVVSSETSATVDSFVTAPATSTATTTPSATSTASATSGAGSLRTLLALNQSLKCNYTSTVGAASAGNIYLSGGMFRGDFSLQGAAVSEAHMIRKGDDVYVWTGNQGAKMPAGNILKDNATANASQTGVDLNQQVKYSCESWTKDDTRFTLPAGVNFLDLAALMQSAPAGATLSR